MPETSVMRIVDASLNRATEGLRAAEDFARFVLDDPLLTRQAKSLRHDLTTAAAAISPADRHAARDTQRDVGTAISTGEELRRLDAWDVCAAGLKRAEQSLRSLEEYGKLLNPDFAGQCESLRYRAYTLEKALDVGRSSRDRLEYVTLCVLMDGQKSPAEFERLAGSLVEAGVGMIQLRDKRLDDRQLTERARTLVALTRRQPPAWPGVSTTRNRFTEKPPAKPGAADQLRTRTLSIINDRADIAATVGADGVHLGQEDLGVKDARSIVGTRMLIGVSTHDIHQARAAVLDGANYLGAGPTFVSSTKSFGKFAGLDYLQQVAAETSLPTFAIGGIAAHNVADVLATGISRVALGAAVTGAADPPCAARELLSMLSNSIRASNAIAKAILPAPSLTSDP